MSVNQPEENVKPSGPPPSGSSGVKIRPSTQDVDIRKYAVDKAAYLVSVSDKVSDVEEATIKIASSIENFIRNGASTTEENK